MTMTAAKSKAAPKAETPEPEPAPKAEPKKAPKVDRLAEIERLINEEIAEHPDAGDGSYVHLFTIQKAVGGLRDSERAWKHLTQSPNNAEAAA